MFPTGHNAQKVSIRLEISCMDGIAVAPSYKNRELRYNKTYDGQGSRTPHGDGDPVGLKAPPRPKRAPRQPTLSTEDSSQESGNDFSQIAAVIIVLLLIISALCK